MFLNTTVEIKSWSVSG